MNQVEMCRWAVVHKISGDAYDDGKERTLVTAVFKYPHLAQEFIEKCLPAATRGKFFVMHTDNL